jgi:pimeloyl-ACP methyl ester carboxylesterase
MTKKIVLAVFAVTAGLCARVDRVIASSVDPMTTAQCKGLESIDFSSIQDAPTQVTGAKLTGTPPGYCQVQGYVAPQVGFELQLPIKNWNGKLIHLGNGGHAGNIDSSGCVMPLARHYACIQSDMGHKGTGGDGIWASNNLSAELDWGYRSTHVATLAGKAITQSFYQRPAVHFYFWGCSTGGRQALQEAQRFPWDFDGIIAGAPPIRLADLYVTFAWGQRAAHDSTGKKPLLNIADLKLLTDGALAKCDMDNGVRDGVISSPFQCSFRAADLACKNGQTTECLTPEKVQAAEKIYSGPVDGAGHSLFGAGAAPGSELGEPALEKYGGDRGIYYLGTDQTPPAYADLTQEGLKYLFFSPAQTASWAIEQFDFDQDYKRLDVMQGLYDSSNPDLDRFKSAGGKMLIYHGLNDLSILPQWIIRYYEKVERVMGGQAQTQSFARLFTLPGVEHCAGGPGADTVDYLTSLEKWVEQGKPPEKLIAYHMKPKQSDAAPTFPLPPEEIAFSRPVYPYPMKAKYLGQGDPNDAANFGPSVH